jgi:transcription termination/antitermination protein NusG
MSNLDTDTPDIESDAPEEDADIATAAEGEVPDETDRGDDLSDAVGDDSATPDLIADGSPAATGEEEAAVADADEVADAADSGPEADAAEEAGDQAEVVSEDELLAQQPRAESPFARPGRWYVVHTQSGYEKKVKQNLEARIVSMNAEETIYEVVIPMEDYVDFKNGKRVVAQRKMFPGYLLVRARLDDTAWFVIRNTPGVTGFVGQGAKPSPLPRRDVEAFLAPKGGDAEEQVARAKPRLEYEIGETVRVKEGPFADFSGEVIEINEDQLKLKVLVNIFGRETPVELEFSKVAKL